MAKVLTTLLGLLVAFSSHVSIAHAQAGICPSVPGVERLTALTKTRFVFFGEIHGTREIPALFGDVICFVSHERPVIVALEWPANKSAAFQTYLLSDGSQKDWETFKASSRWLEFLDGRSSEAMRDLLERLRQMRSRGYQIKIETFQPHGPAVSDHSYYELAMATNIASISARHPDRLVLILVGRLHAGKAPLMNKNGRWPAAMHLPHNEVVSLMFHESSGTAWNCQQTGCGPVEWPDGTPSQRGIRFVASAPGFDGVFSIGSTMSASPPAR